MIWSTTKTLITYSYCIRSYYISLVIYTWYHD